MDKWKAYVLYRKAVSLVFPNYCPFCERVIGAGEFWCGTCEEFLPYVNKTLIPPENIQRLYACCYYTQRARAAVYEMKLGGTVFSVDAFAVLMNKMLSDELKRADMLVPVPGGVKSAMLRGFAPAREIARRLSWISGVPAKTAIWASRGKAEQKGLSKKNRAENAMRSFYFDESLDIRQKHIILVDDVCTTGSTLSACAALLLKKGAGEVVGAVFAKTLDLANYKQMPRGSFRLSVKKRG